MEVLFGRTGNCIPTAYLTAVSGVGIADLLDKVEDEPSRQDDHEDNKGDGDKDQGAAIDVLGRATSPDHDGHQHGQVLLQ